MALVTAVATSGIWVNHSFTCIDEKWREGYKLVCLGEDQLQLVSLSNHKQKEDIWEEHWGFF